MFAALVPLVAGCSTRTGGGGTGVNERDTKLLSDNRVYDALGTLYIRAFRLAKANNQWTADESEEPYLTLGQLRELKNEILKEQGIEFQG